MILSMTNLNLDWEKSDIHIVSGLGGTYQWIKLS